MSFYDFLNTLAIGLFICFVIFIVIYFVLSLVVIFYHKRLNEVKIHSVEFVCESEYFTEEPTTRQVGRIFITDWNPEKKIVPEHYSIEATYNGETITLAYFGEKPPMEGTKVNIPRAEICEYGVEIYKFEEFEEVTEN